MYRKTASSQRRRQHVDRIHPSRGNIDASGGGDDYIANAGNASYRECCDELRQLAGERAKTENLLMIAKRDGDREAVKSLGHRIQSLAQRSSPFRTRRIELERETNHDALKDAMREILPPDTVRAIFDRSNELCEIYKRRVDP